MIVHGGALERARALDLGTDDVISFPFDAAEFAARIRTQFRELAGAWCARWHDSIGGSLPARFADGWASSRRQRLRARCEIDHHLNRRLRP